MNKITRIVSLLFLCASLTAAAQYKIGSIVEDLSLTNYNGEGISLDDFNEQSGVIVIFTSIKCKDAKSYGKRINELHQKYAPQGYPVVAIDISSAGGTENGENANIEKMIKNNNIVYLYATDPEKEALAEFVKGSVAIPYAFLLTKGNANAEDEGEETFKVAYMGAIDDAPVSSEVKEKYLDVAVAKNIAIAKKREHGKVNDIEDDEVSQKKEKLKSSSEKERYSYKEETKVKGGCSSSKL